MFKKVLIVLAAAILVLLGIVATRPDAFRVERSTRIAAPPDVVFGLVNDFHRWDSWSPWAKLDPGMKTTHGGAPAGVGATYAWAGNKEVGQGNMRITESRPPEKVAIRLEFEEPFKAVNATEFTFKPDGTGTRVNWAMSGTNNLMGKAFSLFADMDAMIGKDFDRGLLAMKARAEDIARAPAAVAPTPVPTTVPSVPAPQAPVPPAN